MSIKLDLLKIFDAINIDDHLEVRSILQQDVFIYPQENISIPIKELCGLLIVAAEENAPKIAVEFTKYNDIIENSDLTKYIKIAQKILKERNDFSHLIIESKSIH
jgi:hypothetical protein